MPLSRSQWAPGLTWFVLAPIPIMGMRLSGTVIVRVIDILDRLSVGSVESTADDFALFASFF
jgi:hypothetical protein